MIIRLLALNHKLLGSRREVLAFGMWLIINSFGFDMIFVVEMRWRLHNLHKMWSWRRQSFYTNSFKILKMSQLNWLPSSVWCVCSLELISVLVKLLVLYLLPSCVSDLATHEIKWEGTFNAVSSNIKVKPFDFICF